MGTSWTGLVVGQVAFILLPPVALTLLLTSSPRRTLLLRRPRRATWARAVALALNPLVVELGRLVEGLFPVPDAVKQAMKQSLGAMPRDRPAGPGPGGPLVRGGGLPRLHPAGPPARHRTESAVLLAAFLFGLLHVLLGVFQQFFNALLGVVLG